jgi:deoxyribodipyrimidine photo-lyase
MITRDRAQGMQHCAGMVKARPSVHALVWFRRDLRVNDHAALSDALRVADRVHCAFLFDTEILGPLPPGDARVTFIWESVRELKAALAARGGDLHVLHGRAERESPRLARRLGVASVHAARDYEPAAARRDAAVGARLARAGIAFRTRKDQVIFELDEVRTRAGGWFSVFTPYRRQWLATLAPADLSPHRVTGLRGRLAGPRAARLPRLDELGFRRAELPLPAGMSGALRLWAAFRPRLAHYARERDFPALGATSRLSAHLRFGTISIRRLVGAARVSRSTGAAAWLTELIWRDFYFAILAARPDVAGHAFRRKYDRLEWTRDERLWRAWRDGRTGYPIVDAGMRELAARGTLHNRLRMVVASFLAKDLGLDWRRGERHFAARLLDFDLAANNGGWQWCASTGCDAQPWFRIFNPVRQSERFDPEGRYILRWIPELARVPRRHLHAPWEMPADLQRAAGCRIGRDYPAPVVRHEEARRRTLARYAAARRLPRSGE